MAAKAVSMRIGEKSDVQTKGEGENKRDDNFVVEEASPWVTGCESTEGVNKEVRDLQSPKKNMTGLQRKQFFRPQKLQ